MRKTNKEKKKKQSRTIIKQAEFLAAYSGCGRISEAATIAGIKRNEHYIWMHDKDYAKRFGDAQKQAIGFLEDVAVRRATEGWDEPVFYQGKEIGKTKKYSDLLLIFTLKGLAPEKYRERTDNKHSGEMNQTVKIITSGNGKDEGGVPQ